MSTAFAHNSELPTVGAAHAGTMTRAAARSRAKAAGTTWQFELWKPRVEIIVRVLTREGGRAWGSNELWREVKQQFGTDRAEFRRIVSELVAQGFVECLQEGTDKRGRARSVTYSAKREIFQTEKWGQMEAYLLETRAWTEQRAAVAAFLRAAKPRSISPASIENMADYIQAESMHFMAFWNDFYSRADPVTIRVVAAQTIGSRVFEANARVLNALRALDPEATDRGLRVPLDLVAAQLPRHPGYDAIRQAAMGKLS